MKLNQEDFGTLAICSIRYALGRMTYMPGLISSIVRSNIKAFSKKDLSVMIHDIENPCFGLGDDCNERTWMELLRELRKRYNEVEE